MPTSLYDLIIPTFIKGLQTFDHVLTKAEQYAKEKGLDADEVFPQARLIDDQLPLVFQVQTATKAVQTTIGRLTGVEPTFFEDNEKTIADLHARIQKALEAVKSVKPEDVNSREDVKVELPRPDRILHLTVKEATLYHGQTNFFFHIVTGYSILRAQGVPIGKADYLGSFLAHLGVIRDGHELAPPERRRAFITLRRIIIEYGTGDGDSACFVKGNNEVFLPRDVTSSCLDAALANKFTTEALMILLSGSEERDIDINGIKFPAVYSNLDKLLLIVDPETYLPYIRLRVILEDFVIDRINATANFSDNFFDVVPHGQKVNISEKPSDVPSGLVTDYSTSLLGSPVKNVSVDALKSSRPVDLLQVCWLIIDDSHDLGFKQLIIEFETEVIVCDAPPFWSESVMEWIKKNIGKKITYVAPSHHHRDHSGGVADYVRAGAKLIIPEMAVDYWSSIPGAEFITFNQTHPYVHRDNNVRAWFNWADQAPHAADWTYVMVTERCPNKDSSIFVFEADTWEAGLSVDLGNRQQMRQWLDQLLDDGLPRSAM
ncbi:hypothetical protein F25303_7785 [Fusarium sp. NRRL 25303]|nr:hypothetical protein F25303_7785 [Fusarium sp. NRRL 25303]